jgi:outer membrane protein assembly factor BamB
MVANVFGEMVPMRKPGRRDDVPIARPAPEPVEDLDWRTAPPPVQRTADGVSTVAASSEPPMVAPVYDEIVPSPRRRTPLIAIVVLLAFIVILVTGGIWVGMSRFTQSEERLRAEAEAEYKAERFRPAQKKYSILADKFGRGDRAVQYRLLADLADLHDRATGDLNDATDTARRFVENYSRNPALDPHREDLAKVLMNIGGQLATRAESVPPDVDDLLRRGDQILALLDRYPPRDDRLADLRKQFDRIRSHSARARERRDRVNEILLALRQPTPELARAKRIMREAGLESDAEVLAAVDVARQKVGELVRYEPVNRQPQAAAPPDGPASLLLETAPPPPRSGQGEVVLAVARGLLYALDARNGRRLWVTRVGPDADSLPVRVPGRGDEPELVLVAATDPPALTARDLRTGVVRWHQPLDAAPLGRPVFDAPNRLYVPTAGDRGLIYDLHARTGTLLGQFATHQPLAGGAALDQMYGRLYVPAYGDHVYAFNYHPDGGGPPRREGLLATGHAPGGLRGEPIVVSGEEGLEVPRYLVLGEADGLDAMKLRAFRLVSKPDDFSDVAEIRLPGWSWFSPYADSEKIALVTDAGTLGLFGIKQAGNVDDPLFPLLGFDPPAAEAARQPLRAQLVHAEEYGFWVLAGGVLQHWRLGLDRAKGRMLAPVWGEGVLLGSPLHPTQVSADRSTLFLVTQTAAPATSLATAVDARTGRVQWQRPLGLSCQGDPLRLGDSLLVMAPNAAVYRFDANPPRGDAAAQWQVGGVEIAKPLADLVGAPVFLPGGDDTAYVLACRRVDGKYRFVIRHFTEIGDPTEKTMDPLDSPPAGAPALGPRAIVLPLTDGSLYGLPLDPQTTRCLLGPTWRTLGAKVDAPGFVVHWRGNEFLFTDGTRRLNRIIWPADRKYEIGREPPLELRQRLTALVALSPKGDEPRAIVADSSGTLTLITGTVPKAARTWRVGTVTAGPWQTSADIVAVVDRKRLILLDPDKDEPIWSAAAPADGIEVRPRLIDGRLIIADAAGLFVALDPTTGKRLGPGYRHPAVVAPTAAPAPMGGGRLFAPLTDGSVLVLSITELTKAGN